MPHGAARRHTAVHTAAAHGTQCHTAPHGVPHGAGGATRRRTAFHTAHTVPHGAARQHTAFHTAGRVKFFSMGRMFLSTCFMMDVYILWSHCFDVVARGGTLVVRTRRAHNNVTTRDNLH